QLVLLVLLVQRIEHLEAGEAEVLQRSGVDIDVAELEHFGVVADFANTRGGDFVDFHRYVEVHALMIEAQLERRFGIAPVALVFTKAQWLIIGEGHLTEYRRQIALGRRYSVRWPSPIISNCAFVKTRATRKRSC